MQALITVSLAFITNSLRLVSISFQLFCYMVILQSGIQKSTKLFDYAGRIVTFSWNNICLLSFNLKILHLSPSLVQLLRAVALGHFSGIGLVGVFLNSWLEHLSLPKELV